MQHPQGHFIKTSGILLAVSSIMLLAISCLKEMPETLPDKLEWNPEFALPLGDDSFGLNAESGFDTSLLEYDTISGLPGWVEEDTIVLEGIMDFGMSSILENQEDINRILLRINIYNGFPHEVYSQAYFRDAGMNILDSLFEKGPVTSGPGRIREDGSLRNYGYVRKDALFDKERLLALQNSNAMFFKAGFYVSDVDSTLIPYYRHFEYVVDVGAMVELKTEY
ncbi:MAG: hypothetical protein ABFS28_00760 [Bacteroidota bacterium]